MGLYTELREFFNDFKNEKTMMVLFKIFGIIIIIILIVASSGALWRGLHDKPVNFLWGLYVSNPKDTFTVRKQDTVFTVITKTDTIRITKYLKEKSSREVSKVDTSNKSKFNIKENTFNAPAQIGDNNTQNNFKPLPRVFKDDYVQEFIRYFPSKSTIIRFSFNGIPDNEMLELQRQIISKLKENGYDNIIEKAPTVVEHEKRPPLFFSTSADGAFWEISPNQ